MLTLWLKNVFSEILSIFSNCVLLQYQSFVLILGSLGSKVSLDTLAVICQRGKLFEVAQETA